MVLDNFYWGASTSAFQVEGGYGQGGKGIATTDIRKVPEGVADSKIASDQYHHMIEDVDLMAELGINLYRFSFNWTRVMGNGYQPNSEGIEFYNKLIDRCLEKGIKPFPTLYHFEMPQAFVDDFGGWNSRECIDQYVKYAEVCFRNFGDRVKIWGTINEQLIVTAASDLNGNHESDPNKRMKQMYQMSYNMSLAEKMAIHSFREIVKDGKIGPVCSMQVVYPESPAPEDVLASKNATDFLQNCFLDMSVFGEYPQSYCNYLNKKGWYPETEAEDKEILVANKPDLIGINYYASTCIRALKDGEDNSKLPPFYQNELFTLGTNNYLTKTKWMEFGVDPDGLYIGMRDVYERYKLPMIVTENGLAASDILDDGAIHDDYRIDYLDKHIKQCERFVSEGYPLLGYCPWSLVDVVSSHQGFKKRYGLIYVDRTDEDLKQCKRIPKDSFYWYQEKIKSNK
ncbi:glycoside hydrolase family 1 protein [Lactiplantibacillus plantarum]|uniref:glycoside hydrolase family 1 protein n=1 Tax=Lactiplantibacillus plantarum TaxID=1590 RepID=UPI00136289DA|nr:glycoside hydrolase family 1 protein [Lactiplantibacillus plantarum]MCB7177509.1 glycoside hydrolase family 1 protein [Lactiplantibacillus plantarum]QHM32637.1 Aryl-phospho-beta-D-glucosidase BglC [Lactiplantibacillus plantarum]